MNKYDFELKRLEAVNKVKNTEGIYKTIHLFIVMITFGACFYFLINGLKDLASSEASSLVALGAIVEKLNFAQITSYFFGCMGVFYGLYERRTRKKLEN